MRGGMRAACAVVALGFIGASAAKAATTYDFSLSNGTVLGVGSPYTATGTFTLNGFGVTGGSASLNYGGSTYTLGNTGVSVISFGPTLSGVNLTFGNTASNISLSIQGNAPTTNNTLMGTLLATVSLGGVATAENATFSASPSSGGGSGGVPTPEVNALLGLTLAGGTVAFLRRRRGNRAAEPLAA